MPFIAGTENPGASSPGLKSNMAILAASAGVGALFVTFGAGLRSLLLFVVGAAVLAMLLMFPEVALALYVVIGDVKGDDRVASLFPMDLTLVLGAILLAGIALAFLRAKRTVEMPSAYFLFVALVVLMGASLTYTPVFGAGLEKLTRFLTFTGIVIVGPFFVLGTPAAMRRFLIAFGAAAFAICSYSLLDLGGSERLATPSDNTIGLGHLSCALILLIWLAILPRFRFPLRMIVYPLLAVPTVALIGSGSRGSAIACGVVILVSLFFNRRYFLDLVLVAGCGLVALPFLRIPETSFEYLGTLVNKGSVGALLSFRGDLLSYGWNLLQQHPLIGVGLQGFRYHSPNVALYNWPHNIFLEVACEMGIPAALIVFALFGAAIRESIRQLKDFRSPLFGLSQLAAALLLIGIVNATNTGDINSDRSTWLFVSLVFVMRDYRIHLADRRDAEVENAGYATPALRGSYS